MADFAAAPYTILSSTEIVDGPIAQAQFFTTTKLADANPKVVEALKAAVLEAIDLIKTDTRAAVEIYREVNKDKMSVEELLDAMKQPGMMEFTAAPPNTMKIATHMHRTGTLKTLPKAWTDYYLPVAYDLPGS